MLFFNIISSKKAIFWIILIGLIVYFNSLFNGFVWDDNYQVVENKPIQSLENLPKFFKGSTFYNPDTDTFGGFYYKPILSTYFSGIYTIFGANAFFFHSAQVFLHIVNTILIFILLSNFINNKTINFFLALTFLVHPINVESVSYIAGAQEPLYFFFGMLVLLEVIRGFKGLKSLTIVFICLLIALLSKESGFLFVLIAGIYLIIFKKQNKFNYGYAGLITIFIYSILRFAVAKVNFNSETGSPISLLPLTERIKSIPLIIFTYLKTFIYPKDLIISQYWVVKQINWANFYFPLLAVIFFFAILIAVGIKILRSSKANFLKFTFFFLWFLIGIVFHLQLFPLDLTYSDRWFYFPMAGFLGMTGVMAETVKIKSEKTIMIITGIVTVMILIYSARTIVRNTNWKSNLTVFEHDTRAHKFPDSYEWKLSLEWNLGIAFLKNQKYDQGIAYFQKYANSINSSWYQKYYLGLFYEQKGETDRAKGFFLESMALTKANKKGQIHLPFEKYAILMLHNDPPEKAKEIAQKYLLEFPDNPKLWLVISLTEYKLGNKPESLVAVKKAVSLLPDEENKYVLSQMEKGLPIDLN